MNEPLSLYIHIPFCGKKCDYCDFFSVAEDFHPIENIRSKTVSRILEDTRRALDFLSPPRIETIYIGGGTPNSIGNQLFAELLGGISDLLDSYSVDAKTVGEWTVELNPEYLEETQLDIMERAGVSRLSIGVQRFSDEALELLGRRAGKADVRKALSLVGSRWKGDWSADFMSLIPYSKKKKGIKSGRSGNIEKSIEREVEVEEILERDRDELSTLISYGPGHLSLYGLTVEEETPLHARLESDRITVPDEEDAASILSQLWAFLEEQGYRHYEISNFALSKEEESLHNLRYWRLDPYLGIGPSAVSTIPGTPWGKRGPLRLRFFPDLELYNCPESARFADETAYSALETSRSIFSDKRVEVEEISSRDYLIEHFLTGFRTEEGVSFSRLARRFGEATIESVKRQLKASLFKMERDGHIQTSVRNSYSPHCSGFRATDRGMLISNTLLLELVRKLDETLPDEF